MRLRFTPHGWEDYYKYWQSTDKATLRRLNRLPDDVLGDPFTGIGKPEPLRHILAGRWSRRIADEHQLLYLIDGEGVVIIQVRYRYEK